MEPKGIGTSLALVSRVDALEAKLQMLQQRFDLHRSRGKAGQADKMLRKLVNTHGQLRDARTDLTRHEEATSELLATWHYGVAA